MIAKGLTLIHIHKLFRILNGLILGAFCAGLILLAWQARPSPIIETQIFKNQKFRNEPKRKYHYEKIGRGALSVSSGLKSFPLPDLKREMRFLGKNTRPDASIYDLLIHVGLKESGQALKVVSGQKLYLTYAKGPDPYLRFSSEPTPLWIMPHLSESGKTLVELGIRLVTDKNESLLEEKKTFEIEDLLLKEALFEKSEPFQEAVAAFEKASLWNPDCLFDLYGGQEYAPQKNLLRLGFGSSVLHVKIGDALIWEEGKWKAVDLGKESRGYPLALLKTQTPRYMVWELWSAEGLEMTEVKLEMTRTPALNFRVEEVFCRIRQRTASRISCRIGNKAAILKEGDWILKTAGGWRVLKSLKEIEEVLSFQVVGELFVFDGIEKQKGKPVFSGTLFDPMRTQAQKVQLPLLQQRKQKHSTHKKKAFSSKIHPMPSEEETNDAEKRDFPDSGV